MAYLQQRRTDAAEEQPALALAAARPFPQLDAACAAPEDL